MGGARLSLEIWILHIQLAQVVMLIAVDLCSPLHISRRHSSGSLATRPAAGKRSWPDTVSGTPSNRFRSDAASLNRPFVLRELMENVRGCTSWSRPTHTPILVYTSWRKRMTRTCSLGTSHSKTHKLHTHTAQSHRAKNTNLILLFLWSSGLVRTHTPLLIGCCRGFHPWLSG